MVVPTVQASSVAGFTNSVGVNAHIDSGAPNWVNTARLVSEVSFLGVQHLRDGTPYDWALPTYVALAQRGVKFDLTQENPTCAALTTIGALQDVQRAMTLQSAVPGSVESLEGANEYNISTYDLNGHGSYGNLAWGALDDQDLQAALRNSATLDGVKIVAASTSSAAAIPSVAAFVDASNWHVYGGVGEQLAANMLAGIQAAQASAPGKPVFVTEAGISSSGYGSSFWGVTDEATQGIIDVNALLDGYADGAARTFLYDLMDDTTNTPQENSFGLFHADGSAKAAATDVSNLLALLNDTGRGTVRPGALAYSIAGLPATASSLLLEKSDGTFDIVIWNGAASVSDGLHDLTPPTSNVTVSFGASERLVTVYDPILGRTAQQAVAGATAITAGLAKDPLIVEVAPAPDTLTLVLSEDAYHGDAQFTVQVDGISQGGAQSVTALRQAGQSQVFSFAGAFGSGRHTVGVSFINDAYGGPGLDRNLYVQSVALDGQYAASAPAALWSNGTVNFNLVPVGQPGTLAVHLSEDMFNGDAQFLLAVDGVILGPAQSVTASHAAGQTQAFTFTGPFGTGAHDLAISFINDAYAGPGLDRNLYVGSAELNGAHLANVAAALFSAGTVHFTIGVSTS